MTILPDIPSGLDEPVTVRSLETHLRSCVERGLLAPGDRLPPIREAAWKLGCAPGTVARAYRALELAGLAHGEVGRGTFITSGDRKLSFPQPGGRGRDDIADLAVNSFLIEDASALIAAALAAAQTELAQGGMPLAYLTPGEDEEIRNIAARFLSPIGRELNVDEIVVTAGAQAAIASTFLALTENGGGIACDALTYPGVISATSAARARLHPVRMDDEGMDPEAFEALCRRSNIACVFLMPSTQNPTGRRMSARRCEQLAEVAARHGVVVVEDRIYDFLAEEDARTGVSEFLPGSTVLVTGLSKCVAPILRVGFVAAPRPLARQILAVENALSLMVSPLLTRVAAHILSDSGFEARLAKVRLGISERAAIAQQFFPQLKPEALQGGLAWLELAGGWLADAFAAEAEALGVRVAPARFFAAEPRGAPEAVRLCLGSIAGEDVYRRALEDLASLMARPPRGPQILP